MTQPTASMVEDLFNRHHGQLQAFLTSRMKRRSDAADAEQEVYFRLLKSRNWESIRNPEHYLYAVASNLVKAQHAHGVRQSQEIPVEDPAVQMQLGIDTAFDADLDTEKRRARLLEVVAQLSPRYRLALILRFQYELSYWQIAEHLGISSHGVKKYLSRALHRCRQRMSSLK